MENHTIKIQPLTAEAFAPFGDVIQTSEQANHFSINYGYTERYHDLANIDVTAHSGKAGASIFHSTPLPLPLTLKIMERHPLSSQAFIPMSNNPYLVVVAPPGDFNIKALCVFMATANQGVNYKAGTWHHFCLALKAPSHFLVIDRLPTNPNDKIKNCDEQALEPPIILEAAYIEQAIKMITHGER